MPDAGWIRMYHPDQWDGVPDPDDPEDASKVATVTKESYDVVWARRGWVNLDAHDQFVEDYPEQAGRIVDWIGDDHDRARYALTREEDRDGGGFTTVISHAEKVLAEQDETE